MPRSKSPPRVKFYEETWPDGRQRYRVRLISDGQTKDETFWNKREALHFFEKTEADLLRSAGHTVSEALDDWYAEKIELGTARPTTCAKERPRVNLVLADCLQSNLASVTHERAAAIYKALVERPTSRTGRPRAAASHRHYLRIVQSFFRWCVSKGYLQKSPFADIRPVGRANRGKPQPRNEEATRFITAGLQYYEQTGYRLALAAAMLPIFGLRVSEALTRRVRDIDRGKVWHLVIDEGMDEQGGKAGQLKTRSARRALQIPPILLPHLERLLEGRSPNEYLFGIGSTGKRKANTLLWSAVRRLCDQAGIPHFCPHSMRGYYASAGVRSGALPHVVAANMGHSSFRMTAKHYAEPQAIADAHSVRVKEMLNLQDSAASLSHLRAEALVEALPLDTLARIAELVDRRRATNPTPTPIGVDLPTEIRTKPLKQPAAS